MAVSARPRAGGSSHFSQVPSVSIPRSAFNRSHGHKTTFDSGRLIPIYVDEALPGDTINLSLSTFCRMATPLKPVMDNLYLDTFFFAVPYRLVWDNFNKFMGEQDGPFDENATEYIMPTVTSPAGGWDTESLADYMGIPVGFEGITTNALPLRSYLLIWNEWFRSQELQEPANVSTDDGPDFFGDFVTKFRGKRHDYFTSCLPYPQRGPTVELPIGGTAPLVGIAQAQSSGTGFPVFSSLLEPITAGAYSVDGPGSDLSIVWTGETNANAAENPLAWSDPALSVDLSLDAGSGAPYANLGAASAVSVNDFREAFQIQKLYERDARGGTRYTEVIRSHFGVVSPDARMQRPEYLGGSSDRINVHPVAQTSTTDSQPSPQGSLAAYVTGGGSGRGFVKSFTEHSVVIGLAMVRADLTYQQGLNKMWSRSTRFDYYWPSFAHLGEQAVLSKEILAAGTPADDDVFGYQERYAEYRYKPSQVTGKFRSSDPQSLDVWHLAQDFGARPTLNSDFIEERPPIGRVIAVPSEPEFLFDSWFTIKHVRPMPVYSVPGLIDHF